MQQLVMKNGELENTGDVLNSGILLFSSSKMDGAVDATDKVLTAEQFINSLLEGMNQSNSNSQQNNNTQTQEQNSNNESVNTEEEEENG